MPNRILKESICTSESLATLSMGAEILFYRLMVKADDFGVYHGSALLIKNLCFPLKANSIKIGQIEGWLDELEKAKLIYRYLDEEERQLVQFVKWEQHQRIRAKKSKFPTYEAIIGKKWKLDSNCCQMPADDSGWQRMTADDSNCCRNPIQSNTIQSNPIQRDSAQSAGEIERCFENLWKMYPKQVGKSAVSKKTRKELFEIGFDTLASAIKRYKKDITLNNRDMQYVKNGSTFFNGGWREYSSDVDTTKNIEKQYNDAGFEIIDYGLSKAGDDF